MLYAITAILFQLSITIKVHVIANHIMWRSMRLTRSSFVSRALLEQIRNSMSSSVVCGSVVQNHGGLLNSQQVLVGPHPCPSQRGSSEYTAVVIYPGPGFTVSQK